MSFTAKTSEESHMPPANILHQLSSCGYSICHKLYHSGAVHYLMAMTRGGDKFLIRLDSHEIPLSSSSQDYQLLPSHKGLIPKETIVDALKCLRSDFSGLAFVCDGSVCVVKAEALGHDGYAESVFAMKGQHGAMGKFGECLLPYPIINLSILLLRPNEMESQICSMAQELNRVLIQHLMKHQAELEAVSKKLHEQICGLCKLMTYLQQDQTIQKYEQLYNEIKYICIKDLPEDLQASYHAIIHNLCLLKELRYKSLHAIHAVYKTTCLLKDTSEAISKIMDPIIQEWHECYQTIV